MSHVTLSYQNVADQPTLGGRFLMLSVSDDTGLASNVAEVTFTVTPDVTPPAPPTIIAEFNSLTGFVDVAGTGEAGAIITLTFPNGELVTTVVDTNGNYVATSITLQPDGDVIANQTDIAGNPSGEASDDVDNTGDLFVDRIVERRVISDNAMLSEQQLSTAEFVEQQELEDKRISLREYFNNQIVAPHDVLDTALEDASFTGSVSYSIVERNGDGTDLLIVETVAFKQHINVQLSSSFDSVGGVTVQSWSVAPMDGGALPAWIDHGAGQDFVVIQRPIDQTTIELRVKALFDNGKTAVTMVEINLETSAVTQIRDASVQAQTLSEQLAIETQDLERQG
ncbi:MAG: Ig-like domain-containing protein, partial [Litorimonas sp.]